jgi:dihydrofolate synthase/folylpolyglutamate synthase
LALSLEQMNAVRPKPLVLILGMMNTREPRDFLEPFRGLTPKVLTLTIPGEENAHKASYIADEVSKAGFEAMAFRALGQAIDEAATLKGGRVVICGSLYLGGYVLDRNGTPPE